MHQNRQYLSNCRLACTGVLRAIELQANLPKSKSAVADHRPRHCVTWYLNLFDTGSIAPDRVYELLQEKVTLAEVWGKPADFQIHYAWTGDRGTWFKVATSLKLQFDHRYLTKTNFKNKIFKIIIFKIIP